LPFSYQGPTISSIYPTNGPTAGQFNLTLTGTSFGSTGSVTIGTSTCSPVYVHQSNQIICLMPQGEGTQQQVKVVVSSVTSNTAYFDFNPPVIYTVVPANGPTQGLFLSFFL
jgi:hypothetical protein